MNIAVASDENYVPHLTTLLTSIGENDRHIDEINIYIFDGGFSENVRRVIKGLESVYTNIRIVFLPVSEKYIAETLGGGYLWQDRSLLAYARLLIPEVVQGETCLYLDVDAIVLRKLDELLDVDFEGKAIAGVLDPIQSEYRQKIGLDDGDVYINSGMILWNLAKCREIGFTQLCRDFIQQRKGDVFAMDQGTINGVLSSCGLIKILPPQCNFMTPFCRHSASSIKRFYQIGTFYSDKELRVARKNPLFVHFTPFPTTRPWQKHCKHPLKKLYRYYRRKTAFNEYDLSEDKRGVRSRILHYLYRNLPLDVYRLIMKCR